MIDALRSFVIGSSPIFAHLLDWLQWGQMIDNHVGRGEHKVSVGTRTNALLINIATDRKALYKVAEFYEKMDTELLFGDGVTAADLNDDALGRALDILHDADIEGLYPKLAMSTIANSKSWIRLTDSYRFTLIRHPCLFTVNTQIRKTLKSFGGTRRITGQT